MEADRPGVLPNSSIDNDPASSSSVVMDDDSNDDEWVGVDRANITVTDMTKPRRAGAEDLKETGEPDIVTKKISKPRSKTTVTPVLGDSVRGCARAIARSRKESYNSGDV